MFVINLAKKRMQCLNTYCDLISGPVIEEFCGYPLELGYCLGMLQIVNIFVTLWIEFIKQK